MAGLGPGQRPGRRVEVAGDDRGGVLGVDVLHEVVQPADQPLRGRAGDRQAGQRAAQPGHARRRGQAVPGHVADRDQHMAADGISAVMYQSPPTRLAVDAGR